MEENNDEFPKFFSGKSFTDWLNDKTNPLVYCLLYLDGKEFLLKNSYKTKLHQKTNKQDRFSISVPSDAIDEFNEYVMHQSRYLLGKEITINYHQYGKIQQSFFGIIDDVKDKRNGTGYGDIVLKGKSPTLLLHNGKKHRSFTGKTLKQIVEIINERQQSYAKVHVCDWHNAKGKILPFVVQYNESDYEFLQRLAKIHGEYFYYNGEKLIFGNDVQPTVEIGEGNELDALDLRIQLKPQFFDYRSYDDASAENIDKSTDSVGRFSFQDKGNMMQVVALNQAEKVFTEKPKAYFEGIGVGTRTNHELEEAVKKEREKRQNVMTVKGRSRNPSLKIGSHAELSDINGKAMETYRILEIKHYHEPGEYYNEFVGIPDLYQAPYQDNSAFPKAKEQTAKVIDYNDPEERGRVQVQFPWQEADNEKTPWIRINTLHAGPGKGTNFIPEIGEEVWVGFENGNAERPIVLGTLYNGKEKSGHHTAGNDLKVIKTRSGHTILMNDSEDKMSITILDIAGNTIYLDTVKKSITIQAPETIDIICKNLNIKVEENMKTDVGHNQENTIGKNIKTIAKEEISQDSGKKTIIASGDNTEISARKDLDLYGKKNLIGFTDGKTEFGAKEQMHVYGASSLITAKDKIEYKAPSMNKLPENGEFKYGKEKKILNAKWMCGEMENDISNAFVGDKVSLLVQTRNYEEGESITLKVKEKNDGDVKDGEKEITLTGKVNAEGFAELKEEVEIEKSKEEEQKKEQQEVQKKLEEEKKATEIYKTYEGKDYTFNEWKKYEQKAYDEYRKQKERKSKGFWG